MGRPFETVSSKKGRNRLKKSGDKLVSRTIDMLEQLWKLAEDNPTKDNLATALSYYIQVLPFVKPKLQAIAPAELDENNDITPLRLRAFQDRLEESRERFLGAPIINILKEGNEDTGSEMDRQLLVNGMEHKEQASGPGDCEV